MKRISILTIALIFMLNNINGQTTGTFNDNRDNKTYKTVKIGNQTWMAENLAFKPNKAGSEFWVLFDYQDNISKYGYLYSFETAKDICPVGWRLPTKTDFETLIDNAGKNIRAANKALLPGGKSGFSALRGGWRWYSDGEYGTGGRDGCFWSSSTNDKWGLYLSVNSFKKVFIYSQDKRCGFSVRCIKN